MPLIIKSLLTDTVMDRNMAMAMEINMAMAMAMKKKGEVSSSLSYAAWLAKNSL